jgi:hypothetical protein
MLQLHPTLLEALVEDRVAELQQTVEASAGARAEQGRHRPVHAARQGAGWMLVDLGLRLALPHAAPRER